ncbi:MAG: sensor histidine kinase [Betaproteobacteria bacterium]|nr:sensor histidine kinase [Betaproteobacteria bacterium]
MKERIRTLRNQLLLWVSAPLLALWVISTIIDHDVATAFVNLNYDRALLDTAIDLGRSVRAVDDRLYLDLPQPVIEMLISGERGRYYYRANGPSGEYITGDPDLPDPPESAQSDRVTYYDAVYRNEKIRAVALRVPVRPGSGQGAIMIQVADKSRLRDDFARQILLKMIAPQAILVLLAALTVWFGVGIGLRALSSIRGQIESRSDLDLSPLDAGGAPAEVRPLVLAMNDLLLRLTATLAGQRRFIADAAHQLRTPIAAIKAQSEIALRQVRDEPARATLQQLYTAADHAGHLVSQLLTLARAEPGAQKAIERQPVDLAALARETTMEWVPRALARGIDLGFDSTTPKTRTEGDAFLIRGLLNNLIDNAIRYTPQDGKVTVRVLMVEHSPALEVEDNGPGIAKQERERVFERFYRIPESSGEGCGLGLAIVREIAEGHGATVEVLSGSEGTGSLIRVCFRPAR